MFLNVSVCVWNGGVKIGTGYISFMYVVCVEGIEGRRVSFLFCGFVVHYMTLQL